MRNDRTRLTRAEGRRFGLTLGTAFVAFASLLWWRERQTTASVIFTLGSILLLGGVLAPTRLGPIERAWMGLARTISKVTTPIFMSVVYFLVITPVGILRRTLASNPLRRDPESESYWVRRETPKSDIERQF